MRRRREIRRRPNWRRGGTLSSFRTVRFPSILPSLLCIRLNLIFDNPTDSDYFIYPARCRGYVPLASIEYSSSNLPRLEGVSPASAPSMRLRVYRHEEITRALALPPHLLPIFAALVGNDLADYASELTLPRAARARPLYPGQVDPAEIRRIAAAVASCAGMAASTLAQIQDVVFAVLPLLLQRPSQDPMIMSVLARSAFGYTLRPLETPSSSFPLHPLPTDSPSAVKARSLYRLAYTRSHLSSFHLHVLKHGVVMCQGSVEQPEFTSPMVTLGRPVRTWIYSILQDAFGALPHGSTVTEYVRRGDELYAAPVEVPLLSQLVAASASPFALPSTSPILLSFQPTRFSLFLTALSFPVPLAPPPSSPLFPLFPIVLALRHIQRSHAAKRPWTPHELLSALTVAVLLRLDPLALSAFVQSARLPATPPRDAIQRSVEHVQTLVVVNLLAQSLLLCPGQIDAQGVLGGVPPPFLSFDGAGLHALMGMGQGIERVLGGMSDEVLGMVKALEALVAVV